MAKPDWAGPFGIPETKEELVQAFWTTLILYGVYTAFYALEVWRTIPRMAAHHYLNPSRNAIVRAAMRQTAWPTLSRIPTMLGLWGPIGLIAGMIVVREVVGDPTGQQNDVDRVMRARMISNRRNTGTHVFGSFAESPHYTNPHGEELWYSFNPERI